MLHKQYVKPKHYTYPYLANSFSRRQTILREKARQENTGWVGSSCWSSPIVALAPPTKYHPRKSDPSLGLNINTREHYPPCREVVRSFISKGNGNDERSRYKRHHQESCRFRSASILTHENHCYSATTKN